MEQITQSELAEREWDVFIKKCFKTGPNVDVPIENWDSIIYSYSDNGCDFDESKFHAEEICQHLLEFPKLYAKLEKPPRPNQLILLLGVAGRLAMNEQTFNRLKSEHVFEQIIAITGAKEPLCDTNIKLKYAEMLTASFNHESGIRWVLTTDLWLDIFGLVIACQKGTQLVASRAIDCVNGLLQNTFKLTPNVCSHIIKQMVQYPIKIALENIQRTKKYPPELFSPETNANLTENIDCILKVLERMLVTSRTDPMKAFLKFKIREACEVLSHGSNNTDFLLKIDRIIVILSFYELSEAFDGIQVVNHDPIALSGFLKIVEREVKKGFVKVILELFYHAQLYWKSLSRKMPKYFLNNKHLDVEGALMCFQVEPLVIIGEKLLSTPQTTEEEIRNCFLADMLNIYSEDSLQLGYEIRKHLTILPIDIEIIALDYLIRTKPLYSRKNVAIVFQTLTYCLRDFIKYVIKYLGPNTKGQLDQYHVFADKLLTTILVYLENFDLSWRESIGRIELNKLVFEFLSYSICWPAEVVSKALIVLNKTILNHMSPNMALLVDETQNSSLNDLGPILFSKCFSSHSTVRNATVTVACTICKKINQGFSSFKKIILDAMLPDIILTMASSDVDCAVRTNALKCLEEMVVIKGLSKNLQNKTIEKILEILSTESDSLVMHAAIPVITKTYQELDDEDEYIPKMYQELERLVLEDKEPKIQETAIEFWEKVIQKHLENEGMSDEEFPPFIFSMEKKKIIKLDDKEIRKRILNSLNSLSRTGCFDVFQYVLKNERTSREVNAKVTCVVTKLLKLLAKYDVTPKHMIYDQTYPNLWSVESCSSLVLDESMEDIIEDNVLELINNKDYINTTNTMFSSSTNLETGEPYFKNQFNGKRMSSVDFIDFIYNMVPIS